MKANLRVKFLGLFVALASTYSAISAAEQCSSDAVSDDSCYRLLLDAKDMCRQAALTGNEHYTHYEARMQCGEYDGMGRCAKAQYICIGDGVLIRKGWVTGVRG